MSKSLLVGVLYKANRFLRTSPLGKIFSPITKYAKDLTRNIVHRKLERTFQDLKVQAGPFEGMNYPGFEAHCSAIFPKLLGSYEAELHPSLERLCQTSYQLILDIGCAEGYYAVGLARRASKTPVIAYDIDAEARIACARLADLNGVTKLLTIKNECTPEELSAQVSGKKSLVVCDCEGYEETLFAPEIMESLSASSLIIETHDFLRSGITERLSQRFSNSHQVDVVSSIDDETKVASYQYPKSNSFSALEKRYAMAERRPAQMYWLVLTPKFSSQ